MDHVKSPIVVRKATAGDVASMQAVDVEARQRFREIDDFTWSIDPIRTDCFALA